MNTKQDFEIAARIIIVGDPKHRPAVVDAFVRFFQDSNKRFDEARFRAACGERSQPHGS